MSNLLQDNRDAERIREIAGEISGLIHEAQNIVRRYNDGQDDGNLNAYVFEQITEHLFKSNPYNQDLEDVAKWVEQRIGDKNTMKRVIFIGTGIDVTADDLSETIMDFAGDDPIRIRPSTQIDLDEEDLSGDYLSHFITVEMWGPPEA